jgi:hypothetical protein
MKSFTLALLVTLLTCSCARSPSDHDLAESVAHIREYADSFKGLSAEAVRVRLSGVKIREEDWKEGGFGGKQLVATYPDYELRVLFLGDKVITTSFQVLSK